MATDFLDTGMARGTLADRDTVRVRGIPGVLVVLDTGTDLAVPVRGEYRDSAISGKHTLTRMNKPPGFIPGGLLLKIHILTITFIVSSKFHSDPDLWHRHYHHHNLDIG